MDCGLTPDVFDYDDRTPLHLASAGGRLLAVSFLLGQGADASRCDRWGNTPLDDALKGGTTYHHYCAKLLHVHGGYISGCEEQRQAALEMLDGMHVRDVLSRVKKLLAKGVDRRKPHLKSDSDILSASKLTLSLVEPVRQMRDTFCQLGSDMNGKLMSMEVLTKCFMSTIWALVDYEDMHLQTVFSRMRFESFLKRLEDPDEFDGKSWLGQAEDVSEEQYLLYQELDSHHAARPIASGSTVARLRSRFLQRLLLRLSDISNMHDVLIWLCSKYADDSATVPLMSEPLTTSRGQEFRGQEFRDFLTVNSMYHILMLFVSVFMPLPAVRTTARALIEEVGSMEEFTCRHTGGDGIRLSVMIESSEKFRELLMNEESKARVILGAISQPHVFQNLSYLNYMVLAGHCAIQVLEVGDALDVNGSALYVVVAGSLRMHGAKDDANANEWQAGSVLGEIALLTELEPAFTAKCTNRSVLVQVPRSLVSFVLTCKPQSVLELSKIVPRTKPRLVHEALAARWSASQGGQDQTPVKLFKTAKAIIAISRFRRHSAAITGGLFDKHNLQVQKSMQVFTLLLIFQEFPQLGSHTGEACMRNIFMVWKGITAFQISTRTATGSESRHLLDSLDPSRAGDKITTIVRTGLRLIDECFEAFSSNGKDISASDLAAIQPYLGEVGTAFFNQCLAPLVDKSLHGVIEKQQWWRAWMHYLEGREGCLDDSVNSTSDISTCKGFAQAPKDGAKMKGPAERHDTGLIQRGLRYFKIGSEVNKRILKIQSFEPFQQSYRSIVGSLTEPLLRSDIKRFLQLVLINESVAVGDRDVDEFIAICASAGESALFITFEDLRSLHTRGGKEIMLKSSLFMGMALNPYSQTFIAWHSLVQACALFCLIEVLNSPKLNLVCGYLRVADTT